MSARDADPSILTTQALQREVASLEKLSEQRMNGIEKAVSVAHENLVRVPTDVDKAIGHLKEVMEGKLDTVAERFRSIETQFRERDTRVQQTAIDTKTAVDAALAAAKEAAGERARTFDASIAKSEAGFVKQVDQLGILIQQNTKASDEKIADAKDRLTKLEGMNLGRKDTVTERQATSSGTVHVASLFVSGLIGVAGLAMLIISLVVRQ